VGRRIGYNTRKGKRDSIAKALRQKKVESRTVVAGGEKVYRSETPEKRFLLGKKKKKERTPELSRGLQREKRHGEEYPPRITVVTPFAGMRENRSKNCVRVEQKEKTGLIERSTYRRSTHRFGVDKKQKAFIIEECRWF